MNRLLIALSIALVLTASLWGASPIRAQEPLPQPGALAEVPAPFGLGAADVPSDEAGVKFILARMPDEIDGQPRATEASTVPDDGHLVVAYGTKDPAFGYPLILQALDFTKSDFFPTDFTAEDYVNSVSHSADYGAVAFGRDGPIVWVQSQSTAAVAGDATASPASSRPLYTLAWGVSDSNWLFTAASDSPDGLEALVIAFAMVAGGGPATPIATLVP